MENPFDIAKVTDWLRSEFDSEFVRQLLMFGSILSKYRIPNDCDIIIVTDVEPDTSSWKHLRELIKSNKLDFKTEFNLDLSVTLYTKHEYKEKSYFKEMIKKYPTRIIIDEH